MQSAQRGPAVLQLNAARKRDSHVQSLKTRLRKNMNAITENYELILSRAKVDTNESSAILGAYAQAEQDTYEMSVRAANILSSHIILQTDSLSMDWSSILFVKHTR
ncbi:unnamed protein product [Echinostoma caproni]|uniref:Mediator of RNA polymerase II transcription subunit 22 n=1 Tax=Echinostoma caproni TaxID=27848 RepID=A0A183B4Q4_9TREM|nr:unnamed protein product [Echinostoma caproni]